MRGRVERVGVKLAVRRFALIERDGTEGMPSLPEEWCVSLTLQLSNTTPLYQHPHRQAVFADCYTRYAERLYRSERATPLWEGATPCAAAHAYRQLCAPSYNDEAATSRPARVPSFGLVCVIPGCRHVFCSPCIYTIFCCCILSALFDHLKKVGKGARRSRDVALAL